MTFGLPVLIAMGPCLLMGMAMLALLVVHHSFSPVRHALLWAAGCAAGALQWALLAVHMLAGGPSLRGGGAADLCGLASILLLVEGFRVRAAPRPSAPLMIATGFLGVAAFALAHVLPAAPIRACVASIIPAALLGWAAAMLLPRRVRPGPTEVAAAVTLVMLALINLAAAGLAAAEQSGLVSSHHLYTLLYLTTAAPACAATALAVLLLIAHDFSSELRRLGHTDPLTGVLNRHGLDHAARRLLQRARSRPLSVAIADIDLFKQVNDRHGHAAGDASLRCFATHLADGLDRNDAVARIGGEEFALLLSASSGDAARSRIEDLRTRLASLRIEGHQALALTASFGVAEHRPGDMLEQTLERADAALYRSKREGRDRTTLAPVLDGTNG